MAEAENIVYGILVGAAGLIAMTGSTYLMAFAIDRCCSSPYSTERIYSPVSNKADLWGMGCQERRDVLDWLFANKKLIVRYDKSTAKSKNSVEIELTELKSKNMPRQPNRSSANETTTENESETTGLDRDNDVEQVGTLGDRSPLATNVQDTEDLQQSPLCSICLVEFEKGVKVMTGMHCSHLYHVPCIMEWMQKGHDHCPICRKLMMTPQDMHTAALQVLGEKRVKKLARPDMPIVAVTTPTRAPRNIPVSNRVVQRDLEAQESTSAIDRISSLPASDTPDTSVREAVVGIEERTVTLEAAIAQNEGARISSEPGTARGPSISYLTELEC